MDWCREFKSAMEKYEDDIKAEHNEAAQYWKGQADVYALMCALNIICDCKEANIGSQRI